MRAELHAEREWLIAALQIHEKKETVTAWWKVFHCLTSEFLLWLPICSLACLSLRSQFLNPLKHRSILRFTMSQKKISLVVTYMKSHTHQKNLRISATALSCSLQLSGPLLHSLHTLFLLKKSIVSNTRINKCNHANAYPDPVSDINYFTKCKKCSRKATIQQSSLLK